MLLVALIFGSLLGTVAGIFAYAALGVGFLGAFLIYLGSALIPSAITLFISALNLAMQDAARAMSTAR